MRMAHVDPDAGERPTESGRTGLVGDPGLAASGRARAGLGVGALALVPAGRVERGGLVRARPPLLAGPERAVEGGRLLRVVDRRVRLLVARNPLDLVDRRDGLAGLGRDGGLP